MKNILLVDFGSTYTKLTLVDLLKESIIETTNTITTVESNALIGYKKALSQLKYKGKIDKVLACSSAAGGLKMIAIGLTKNLTAEAAKRAALGAGARVLKTYFYELSDKNIEEINNSECDIILLSGGTEGGNKDNIIFNAKKLTKLDRDIPIVISGNSQANEELKEIFYNSNQTHYITENVMPAVNTINPESAQECIRKIFMDRITRAKGMNKIEEEITGILMPTPGAVIKAAKVLSTGTKKESGLGDLMVVDVGGATTDVHSIADGFSNDREIRFEGLREPFAKRTVEGDLGMRYSAYSLYQACGQDKLKTYLHNDCDIMANIEKRTENIKFVPRTEDDYDFDEAMAKVAIEIAVNRHSGKIRKEFSYSRYIYYQRGKDLSHIKYIIGTGGVIVHSKNPQDILKASLNKESLYSLVPEKPEFLVDKSYILSAMGLLAEVEPDIAVRIMKKYIKKA